MKKALLSMSLIFIFSIAQAQFYADWTESVAITDSLSINNNACVYTADYISNDVFCFYEKKLTTDSPSQIWFRNIYTMTDEQLMIGSVVFEFRNPKVFISYPYYNSKCFIIYESNESGNFDLYGVEFFINDSLGSTFQLTNTSVDESSFFVGEGENYQTACWISENAIQFARITTSDDLLFLEEITTIDTNNCFDPICFEDYVFYRKIVNDDSHIYFSKFDESENQWSSPDTIYATGNNVNLTTGKFNTFLIYDTEIICWENNGQVLEWNTYSATVSQEIFNEIDVCYEPSFLTYDIYVNNFIYPAVFSFCIGEENERKVFVYDEMSFEGQIISNYNIPNNNPELFYGKFHSNYFNATNIWQSQVNDNIVLYLSQKSILMGAISEKNRNNNKLLKTSPNPFKSELLIEYYLSTNNKASINIYSITGELIEKITLNSQKHSWNTYTWEPDISEPEDLPEGIYFIVLKQGNEIATQKVIYSK